MRHSPTIAAFLAMVIVAGGLAISLDPYSLPNGASVSAQTTQSIELPAPEHDQDLDGYANEVDQFDGNAMVRLEVVSIEASSGTLPYVQIGTQDDHFRFGVDRELAWKHVYDADPLDWEPGGPTWTNEALRTGLWHRLQDNEPTGDWPANGEAAGRVVWLDVRDDRKTVSVTVEVWDERARADEKLAQLELAVGPGHWGDGETLVALEDAQDYAFGELTITLRVSRDTNIDNDKAAQIAQKWAPTIHFDSGEAFYPTDPALMERFHGFTSRAADLRTWSFSFNNGRDGYRLLAADFDGDHKTTHSDVELLWDILRTGVDSDTVWSQVTRTTGDQVAVQYWLLYPYNFVVGDDGLDVAALAHAGDREFVQLLFANEEEALAGVPLSVSYSQHYSGIRIDNPNLDELPFINGRLQIYPARGSHASYPVPGDDEKLRNTFAGFGDRFDGEGVTWEPSDYTLSTLEAQPWHLGYKWGPITRHHRDLGSPGKPLLAHSFVYPYHEPVRWAEGLPALTSDELASLYGGQS